MVHPALLEFIVSLKIVHFNFQNSMFHHFHIGERKQFFELWNEFVPPNVRDSDSVAQKLEFYLNIYFATSPVRKGSQVRYYFIVFFLYFPLATPNLKMIRPKSRVTFIGRNSHVDSCHLTFIELYNKIFPYTSEASFLIGGSQQNVGNPH